MLGEIVLFLKDRVNDHLRTSGGWSPADPEPELVVLPGGERADGPEFKLERVTLLVVNLEEDHTVRPADPTRRVLPDGTSLQVKPPIALNAYVLFAARFKEYDQGLRHLARVLQFFQSHRAFDPESAPDLYGKVERLGIELLSLPFSEQNLLWGTLRAAYLPSLLYRVRTLVYRDEHGVSPPAVVETATAAGVGP